MHDNLGDDLDCKGWQAVSGRSHPPHLRRVVGEKTPVRGHGHFTGRFRDACNLKLKSLDFFQSFRTIYRISTHICLSKNCVSTLVLEAWLALTIDQVVLKHIGCHGIWTGLALTMLRATRPSLLKCTILSTPYILCMAFNGLLFLFFWHKKSRKRFEVNLWGDRYFTSLSHYLLFVINS